MSTAKRFHCQAGEYTEQERERLSERRGKVVRFLKANPLSTSKEIATATSGQHLISGEERHIQECRV